MNKVRAITMAIAAMLQSDHARHQAAWNREMKQGAINARRLHRAWLNGQARDGSKRGLGGNY